MSEFMNKKEQTISFVLTRRGRQEFSSGKFRPTFYSFHDDGVVYDGNYIGVTENQKDIVPRIKDDPQFEPNGIFSRTVLSESFSRLGYQLGMCDPTTQHAPAFHLSIESAKISGSIVNQTGSYCGVVPKVTAVTTISKQNLEVMLPEMFITLDEEWGIDSLDNFEVELFSVDSSGNLNKINEPTEFFQLIPDERLSTVKVPLPVIYTDRITINQKECIE